MSPADQEFDDLYWRWEHLSQDETLPQATRHALQVCLQDLRETVARIQTMPNEHPSGEHDE